MTRQRRSRGFSKGANRVDQPQIQKVPEESAAPIRAPICGEMFGGVANLTMCNRDRGHDGQHEDIPLHRQPGYNEFVSQNSQRPKYCQRWLCVLLNGHEGECLRRD